jgi:hypothetical protein
MAIRIALTGLLLSAAALCGFGCWGIRALVISERRIAADADGMVLTATATENKVSAIAENVNGLITDVRPKIATTIDRAGQVITKLDATASELGKTVVLINAPCVPGPCGTLADVNRTLGSMRLAAGQVTAFSYKEQEQLQQVNTQETEIAQATKDDLTKLGSAIDGVTTLTGNKDLKESLGNLNVTIGAVSGMAADTQQAWHSVLHPSWPKRVWSAITGVGMTALKFFM